eukprot:g2705.t1
MKIEKPVLAESSDTDVTTDGTNTFSEKARQKSVSSNEVKILVEHSKCNEEQENVTAGITNDPDTVPSRTSAIDDKNTPKDDTLLAETAINTGKVSGISSNTELVEKNVDQKLMNKTESNIAKTENKNGRVTKNIDT